MFGHDCWLLQSTGGTLAVVVTLPLADEFRIVPRIGAGQSADRNAEAAAAHRRRRGRIADVAVVLADQAAGDSAVEVRRR